MRYLGLDLGKRTLGLAISDKSGFIATPYKLIRFNDSDYDVLLPQLKAIVEEEDIYKLVLGLPKNMNNTIGPRGEETIAFKEKLESFLKKEIILEDERLTTVQATNYLLEADMSRKKRKEKVDSLAATLILQSYLDRKKD